MRADPAPGATSCAGTIQRFATPQWNRVTPFALSSPSQFALPPGHWAMVAQAASRAGGLSLDVNAKGFFALGNALLDASIATWNTKVVQDTVRPITYIRWLYKGKKVKGWTGPGSKMADEDGSA